MKTISPSRHGIQKISLAGLIITLGIVYGDIGTSPLYVMRAILSGSNGTPSLEFIYGAISCVIWTLTLQTTIKYVLITLRADNNGEGGILALFALIRKRAKWVFVFAMIGGAMLLADGVITPAITVVSAIEGLRIVNPEIPVIPIVLVIISALFLIQQFGTNILGRSFGPIMLIWFLMMGIIGFQQILTLPSILKAFNPYYAFLLLTQHPGGFLLLGAVFLCTTGAEDLYVDLGHCGLKNIRITWIFVKACLILNYLGQGAWILNHAETINSSTNPFFSILPPWFLIPGVIIATSAAVIASQALISGAYSVISEAIQLNFWPKVKVLYPATSKGQIYIPSINKFLWIACCCVILFFKESARMEAAYGLAITITMLMTTILLSVYLRLEKKKWFFVVALLAVYLTIEGSFLIANMYKFVHGGWVTILIATGLLFIMYVWFKGREIKKSFLQFVKIDDYKDVIVNLSKDQSIPKYASNLVYLTKADLETDIESKIIYSIIHKRPKRADTYWLIHIHIVDEPRTMEYTVHPIVPDVIFRVEFRLGYKVDSRINLYFKQVLDDLVANKEFDIISKYQSLHDYNIMSDFRFVVIERIQNYDFDFKTVDQFIMDAYYLLKKTGISDVKAFGLDTSNVEVEMVPLLFNQPIKDKLKRIT